MFLDLFKKDRYPIRLETVRAAKSVLYRTISYDIELLNGYYGISRKDLREDCCMI